MLVTFISKIYLFEQKGELKIPNKLLFVEVLEVSGSNIMVLSRKFLSNIFVILYWYPSKRGTTLQKSFFIGTFKSPDNKMMVLKKL